MCGGIELEIGHFKQLEVACSHVTHLLGEYCGKVKLLYMDGLCHNLNVFIPFSVQGHAIDICLLPPIITPNVSTLVTAAKRC